jgi:hypothetical protein
MDRQTGGEDTWGGGSDTNRSGNVVGLLCALFLCLRLDDRLLERPIDQTNPL